MHGLSRGAFYVLFTASGFAGLIYESIWTHYLKLFLGHAAYAQSLVLVVFMGGMALGAAYCGRISERIVRPLHAYALVEAVIGALGLLFHFLFVGLTDWAHATLLPALPGDWTGLGAKVLLAALLILPQSFLLGATFPLMSAGLVRRFPESSGRSIALLYFTNSLGAAAGVLVSGFILIERSGLPGTLQIAATMNLALAAVVWVVAGPSRQTPLASGTAKIPGAARLLLSIAFLTGLASFIYEISWIRMLSLVLGASTHSFELMLSTFILGLALGGLAVNRLVDAVADPRRLLGWVQVAMGLAALATVPLYNRTFDLMEYLMQGLARTDEGFLLFNLSGQAISALVMLPATFFAGMTLPLLTAALIRSGAGEAAIGRVYAANTLGAIAGVLIAVHLALPHVGLKGALLAGSLLDAGLGIALLYRSGSSRILPASVALACALLFAVVALGVTFDANRMTAGVFRYGDLSGSRDARVVYSRDGKTATVHLVEYSDALSIRTNGKSDGSLNLPGQPRGTDEITMVLTGALPLALKPDAKSAAVIGIGTGLTMHTLLQSLAIEKVETVEIEAAMAEAARGFMPRNAAAFADPRGTILIDDAKTFFSTRNRRYDIIISEPSNPWVSGVASLFTREFYEHIRTHLAPGGVLVQWFQLYEIDPSLLASVMNALGETFPHYAIFAPSDHDILIVASESPIPLPPSPKVFDDPGLARELWTIHTLTAGDLDARFLGSRSTLEPLFASYAIAANSDYRPVLDLNAARDRFTEKSATSVVELLNAQVPVLEMLEPSRSLRPINPLYQGAYGFARIENTRLAHYALDFMLGPRAPSPAAIPTQLQKDLEIVKTRLIECRAPQELDVWLHSLLRVARTVNPYVPAADAQALWDRIGRAPCFATLLDFQQRWIALAGAVGARDGLRMAQLAVHLLATQRELHGDAREYLVISAMTGALSAGRKDVALTVWNSQEGLLGRAIATPLFRLLRCHAGPGDCAAPFRQYARR